VQPTLQAEPSLYVGSLTIRVTTRVNVGGNNNNHRNLAQLDASINRHSRKNAALDSTTRVETVPAGTVSVQGNNAATQQKQALPAAAIAGIAVAGVACMAAVAVVGAIQFKRARNNNVLRAADLQQTAAGVNPLFVKKADITADNCMPEEDIAAAVVELSAVEEQTRVTTF
jgi:hypothetical protein